MNPLIQGLLVEGDLVIRLPTHQIIPRGWGRLTWAWHALRGRPFVVPETTVISQCVIGNKLIFKEPNAPCIRVDD